MRGWIVAVLMVLTTPSVSAAEVRVVAAGSLTDAFNVIFADYKAARGVSVTPAWGPSGVLRERLQGGEPFDVFASAALPHAQALTDGGLSGPAVLFARNALCVVTTADREVGQAGLIDMLLRPDVRIGTSTPVADPGGDYTWELFRRIDAKQKGAFEILSGKAQQLFGGATTTAPVNGRHRLEIALAEHRIDAFVYYCSSARQIVKGAAQYRLIELPSDLAVGPEYGLTVSRKAGPDAAEFAMYLLSPRGQTTLRSFGFIPVTLPIE